MIIEVTQVDNNFVVSINEIWFPGSYTTEEAAKYAAENLSDEQVEEIRETRLRDEVNKRYLPISMKHIEEYLKCKRKK